MRGCVNDDEVYLDDVAEFRREARDIGADTIQCCRIDDDEIIVISHGPESRGQTCISYYARSALAFQCKATSKPNLAFDFSAHLGGKTLLFIGAHPDDEIGVAPMFAEACLFNEARCHFVVASEANSWGCYLTMKLKSPAECSRIRREEMQRSAKLLGGDVTFFGWTDTFYAFDRAGLERNLALWANDHGGHAALVDRIAKVLASVQPDIVFTLDPRHGLSCHPNHRAVAQLLLEAIGQLEPKQRPEVWFENSLLVEENMDEAARREFNKGAFYSWPDATAPIYWYDASKALPNGKSGFDYQIDVIRTHRSQYPDVVKGERVLSAPKTLQRIPFVRLADIDPNQDLCTGLALDYPTFDKHGYPDAK